MKKIILTILFILLATLAAYYLFFRKGTTLNESEKLFAIINTKEINRIDIIHSDKKLSLVKKSNVWTINNKEIRQDLMNTLLGVSEGLDAISPVSHHQHDSVLTWLDKGIKLVFYLNDNIINSFKILKHDNIIYGKLENSKNPYKLSLRGFPDIDLTKIYSADEEHWMINLLMDFEPSIIKSILLEYPLNPVMGFQMEKKSDNQFYISKIGRFVPLQDTDIEIINEYLYFFTNIRYYHVVDSAGAKKDISVQPKSFFHLKLCTDNDSITEIFGYEKPNTEIENPDPSEFYATSEEKGIMLLKYNDFDPILVNCDYFLKK